MVHKLEEFFSQQLTSSKRALSQFGPIGPLSGRMKGAQRKNSEECEYRGVLSMYLDALHGCGMGVCIFLMLISYKYVVIIKGRSLEKEI